MRSITVLIRFFNLLGYIYYILLLFLRLVKRNEHYYKELAQSTPNQGIYLEFFSLSFFLLSVISILWYNFVYLSQVYKLNKLNMMKNTSIEISHK